MEPSDQRESVLRRWAFEAVVFGTMGLLLFFMVGGMEPGIYAAGLVGAVASAVLGRFSVQRQWVTVAEGIKRFGILWLWVVGFAALSLLNGKWEPAVFAGVVGLTMTGLYALGARSGR
jgi:hypothetical protein